MSRFVVRTGVLNERGPAGEWIVGVGSADADGNEVLHLKMFAVDLENARELADRLTPRSIEIVHAISHSKTLDRMMPKSTVGCMPLMRILRDVGFNIETGRVGPRSVK